MSKNQEAITKEDRVKGSLQALGWRIRKLRQRFETDWTQEQLVEKLKMHGVEITQGYLSKIERGEASVTVDVLFAMLAAFKVTPEVLLGANVATDVLLGTQARRATGDTSTPSTKLSEMAAVLSSLADAERRGNEQLWNDMMAELRATAPDLAEEVEKAAGISGGSAGLPPALSSPGLAKGGGGKGESLTLL